MDKDMLGNLIIWSVINKLNYMVLNKKKKKSKKKKLQSFEEESPASHRSSLPSVSNFLGWMGSLQLAKCFGCSRFLRGREVR